MARAATEYRQPSVTDTSLLLFICLPTAEQNGNVKSSNVKINPCPENFSQNVVDYPNLLGGGGGVIYYTKSEVLELESNLLVLGVG